jgi:hypothetical protein
LGVESAGYAQECKAAGATFKSSRRPRNTDTEYQPAGDKLPADRSESLVLMLLIQLCLRWLMPVPSGVESSVAPFSTAPVAIENMASQHHIGLAPIHAPPPMLRLS